MRPEDLTMPIVPAAYALVLAEVAEARGVPRDVLFEAAGAPPGLSADPAARISALTIASIFQEAVRLTGEPALGFEVGLSSSITSHGIMGFGMMTCSSLREAIEMGTRLLALRVPFLSADLRIDDAVAVVSVSQTVPLGDFLRPLLEVFLVKIARIGSTLADDRSAFDHLELWFEHPAPDYYEPMRDRLPKIRFEMGSNEVRFDAALLDRRPETADPINAKLIEDQCRRELEQLGLSGDVVTQVRASLVPGEDGYPSLGDVAERLNTSSRTLKRHLHDQGTSYQALLDGARRAEGMRLLATTALSVEQIARRLGYADASSFRRAFGGWTDSTPSEFRDSQQVRH